MASSRLVPELAEVIFTLTRLNLHPMARSILPQPNQGNPSVYR
jgi:hypothetical protein